MGNPYIMWNAMAALKKDYLDEDLNILKNQVDLTSYYRPYEMMWDMIRDPDDMTYANPEYCIHPGDTHPNHKCYVDWSKGVHEWIDRSGFKLHA